MSKVSEVSYEVLTTVKKTFVGKTLRAYVFTAQIVVNGITYPVKSQIPASNIKTDEELKSAIVARMDELKATYEKKVSKVNEHEKHTEPVVLPATGVFKDVLSATAGL